MPVRKWALVERLTCISQTAAALLAERQAHGIELRDQALLIENFKHRIAKLQHERFGQSSERRALLDQLKLQLFGIKEDQTRPPQSTPRPWPHSYPTHECASLTLRSDWTVRCAFNVSSSLDTDVGCARAGYVGVALAAHPTPSSEWLGPA